MRRGIAVLGLVACGGMVEPAPPLACDTGATRTSCSDVDFFVFDRGDVGDQCRTVGCRLGERCAVATPTGFDYGVCR